MRYTLAQIKQGTGFERGAEFVSAKWADELLAALDRLSRTVLHGDRQSAADYADKAGLIIEAAKNCGIRTS